MEAKDPEPTPDAEARADAAAPADAKPTAARITVRVPRPPGQGPPPERKPPTVRMFHPGIVPERAALRRRGRGVPLDPDAARKNDESRVTPVPAPPRPDHESDGE